MLETKGPASTVNCFTFKTLSNRTNTTRHTTQVMRMAVTSQLG